MKKILVPRMLAFFVFLAMTFFCIACEPKCDAQDRLKIEIRTALDESSNDVKRLAGEYHRLSNVDYCKRERVDVKEDEGEIKFRGVFYCKTTGAIMHWTKNVVRIAVYGNARLDEERCDWQLSIEGQEVIEDRKLN